MNKYLIYYFLLLLFFVNQSVMATVNQRAIVVGIDTYDPKDLGGRWFNLDGCANDAQSVKQVLEARYGFRNENIKVLINDKATRDNILNSFDEMLKSCEAGDIAVIYYAGHGSQVKNTLSKEKDLKDESMVPADSYLGAKDIRDKELAQVFNKFADKGVLLTILYDCCHSGSMGRGVQSHDPPKLRHLPANETYDAKDPTTCTPPENRGVLIISASQDNEFASEQYDSNGKSHGAFTIALLQSLTSLPVNSSSADIFSSVRAIMKFNGKSQEPVLGGTEERKAKTIFGIEKGVLNGKTMVAALDVKNNEIVLQGGYVIGIYPNSELSCTKGDSLISVRVKTVNGINKCTATVTEGNIKLVMPGDLFELKNWCMPGGSGLKVYITPSQYTYTQINSIAKSLRSIGEKSGITLITDPIKQVPTHTIFFSDGKWYEGLPDNKVIDLGLTPDPNIILNTLTEESKVYISLPPPNNMEMLLKARYKIENAVEAVNKSSEAQYFLTGRLVDEKLEYAYFVPQISGNDTTYNNVMPLRTNYFSLEDSEQSPKSVTDSLTEFSLKIAKIKAWLTLTPPPDNGSFPFKLTIKNSTTGRFVSRDEVVREDDILGFYLEMDQENIDSWDKIKRYIYVFSIDSKGKTDLWFPLSGSVENTAPDRDTEGTVKKLTPLGNPRTLKVIEPFGIDTYILLVTNEPIPNPGVINQSGVLTRDRGFSGFSQLMNIGSRIRGQLITPSEWGIQKISIKSIPK